MTRWRTYKCVAEKPPRPEKTRVELRDIKGEGGRTIPDEWTQEQEGGGVEARDKRICQETSGTTAYECHNRPSYRTRKRW